jgi:hypothetical protein
MKEAENLNNYFDCFIKLDNGWTFFVGIKDYVRYINETREFKAFVDNLKQERSVLLEEESSLEKVSEKELLDSLTKVRAIIAKNKLENNPEIKRITNDIKSYLNPNGGLRISGKLSDNLNDYFFEICRNTPEQKRFDLFKQFIDKSPRRQNIYGNFSFSRTIEKRRDLTYHIEHRDNIELWSDWMRLEQVPPFIEAPNIFTVDLKDGDTKYAYELIKARIEYDKNKSIGDFTKIIPLYKNSATKIQNYLTRKINDDLGGSRPNDGRHFLEQKQTTKAEFKLKSYTLIVNQNLGDITMNGQTRNLNPESKEFLCLLTLLNNPDYKATYSELLKKDAPSRNEKRLLGFTIRDLRCLFKELLQREVTGKDIIANIKNHGYKIPL